MKVNIIISFILLLIIYLFLKCKESFHPIPNIETNNINMPLHNVDKVDYRNYITVGDGIKATIGNNIDNNIITNKINVCNECKIRRCKGSECSECNNLCSFTNNDEAKYAIIPIKDFFSD